MTTDSPDILPPAPLTGVSLIGYRGTGKTSVGQRLAQRLGWPWVDTDQCIVELCGQSIAKLFAEGRESEFRSWETRVLAELDDGQRRVVSLGGGAVMREANRRLIQRWGPVVWLQADLPTILDRLTGDPRSGEDRPPLTDLDQESEIREKLAEREPVYRRCASLVVDTRRMSVDQIVQHILSELTGKKSG
jgi:shikimate kinase